MDYRIKMIKELLDKIKFDKNVQYSEFEEDFNSASIGEIKEEMWTFYCIIKQIDSIIEEK